MHGIRVACKDANQDMEGAFQSVDQGAGANNANGLVDITSSWLQEISMMPAGGTIDLA